jgi:hypothetical protein
MCVHIGFGGDFNGFKLWRLYIGAVVYVQRAIWSDDPHTPVTSSGYNLGHMGVTPTGVITRNLLQVQPPTLPHLSYVQPHRDSLKHAPTF